MRSDARWTEVFMGMPGRVSRRAASSPVTPTLLWTASGKKLALSKPYQSFVEHSVSSRDSADGACSSDSSSEMKGLWLIDIGSLLASSLGELVVT